MFTLCMDMVIVYALAREHLTGYKIPHTIHLPSPIHPQHITQQYTKTIQLLVPAYTDRGLPGSVVTLSGTSLRSGPTYFTQLALNSSTHTYGRDQAPPPHSPLEYNKKKEDAETIHQVTSARAFPDPLVPAVAFSDLID